VTRRRRRLPRRMINPHPQRPGYDHHGSVALDASGSRVRPKFRGATIGKARHRVIQDAVIAGHRDPGPDSIADFVFRHDFVTSCTDLTSRQMARRHLGPPTATYFKRHTPEPDWVLLGVEVAAGRNRFDIVWRLPDGGVLIDELKTEQVTLAARARLGEQVAKYLRVGAEIWPGQFAGLRLCLLYEPWDSKRYYPDGTWVSMHSWP
jgi:hypothetical protein